MEFMILDTCLGSAPSTKVAVSPKEITTIIASGNDSCIIGLRNGDKFQLNGTSLEDLIEKMALATGYDVKLV